MNKKIVLIVLAFLLMVPFRLPISVLFIELVTSIASLGSNLTPGILVANVVVTKIIYNIALAVMSIYNIEMLSRKIKDRYPNEGPFYWWTFLFVVLYLVYVIFDAVTSYHLFYHLIK